jgi:hypothetical protein
MVVPIMPAVITERFLDCIVKYVQLDPRATPSIFERDTILCQSADPLNGHTTTILSFSVQVHLQYECSRSGNDLNRPSDRGDQPSRARFLNTK